MKIKKCDCGGRPRLEYSEGYYNLKKYFRYVCDECGKHTKPYENTHDAFKEWEVLNTEREGAENKIKKIEMPELSPEQIKECREFNKRVMRRWSDEKEELKPCPFCGGEAKIQVIEKGVKSIIYCTTPECGFMRHSFNNGDTDENAALRLKTAWNRRSE